MRKVTLLRSSIGGVCLGLALLAPDPAVAVDRCASVPEDATVRTKVIVSDLHLGPGHPAGSPAWDPLEDFRFEATFALFLEAIGRNGPVDLVIAGDFIDFWQILPTSKGSTEGESVAKLELALARHNKTFTDLQRFLQGGNRLILIPGNHDVDLQWPAVQDKLKVRLGSQGQVFFAIPCYESHGLHVEHGHQYDRANRFTVADAPLVDSPEGKRLETNWGSVFVSSFYTRIEQQKSFIDNLSPSLAAVWWALRSEPAQKFGLPEIGRLLVMLLRDEKALDNLGYLAYTLGPEDVPPDAPVPVKDVDHLISLYAEADPALAQPLRDLLQDPGVRQDAESELAQMPAEEWRGVRLVKGDPVLMRAFVDPYRRASQQIVRQHPSIRVVVMGHTHEFDARVIPLHQVGETPRWYVNTGCWQKSLSVREARKKWSWSGLDLDNPAMFPDRFSYVTVSFDANGQATEPKRAFWPAAAGPAGR